MESQSLKFDPVKLKEAAQQCGDIRSNIIAVKGEEFGHHVSFFIALDALADLISPSAAPMAIRVINDLSSEYIRIAKISDEDQKEIARIMDQLTDLLKWATVK